MCYVLTCTCGTSGIVGCLWKGVGLGGGETPFLLSTLLCTCVPCPCVTSKKDRIKYSSCWMIFFLKYRLRVLGIPGLPWRMLATSPIACSPPLSLGPQDWSTRGWSAQAKWQSIDPDASWYPSGHGHWTGQYRCWCGADLHLLIYDAGLHH